MGMPKREWLEDMGKILGPHMVLDYLTILALWYRDVEKNHKRANQYEEELTYFFGKGFEEVKNK